MLGTSICVDIRPPYVVLEYGVTRHYSHIYEYTYKKYSLFHNSLTTNV